MTALGHVTSDLSREISTLRRELGHQEQQHRDSSALQWQSSHRDKLALFENKLERSFEDLARTNFLFSLTFDQIDDRYDTIATAHSATYTWATEVGTQTDKKWENLASWIQSQDSKDNIFWVSGQPGCGKSTLMKHVARSDSTKQLLKQWAGYQPVFLAQCFFWSPGTEMQRSLEGMLRTLLSQLLGDQRSNPAIIQSTCPTRWLQCFNRSYSNPVWTVPELLKVFQLVVQQMSQTSCVALFVDGLDEYGKDNCQRQELVKMFLSLRDLSRVKMCLSSRPWNCFVDAFQDLPSLILEELNRPDIEAYVVTEFYNSQAFRELLALDPEPAISLCNAVIDRSSGVFLWVFLATSRLLAEIQDGIGFQQAGRILDEIPQDLDAYFRYMLQRIRPSDRVQASRIYQAMASAHYNALAPVMGLSFTSEAQITFAASQSIRDETIGQNKARVASMIRYFKSQSMDLLILRPLSTEVALFPWWGYKVEYLHRTVADFLRTQAPQNLLQSYTEGEFDVPWYCANAQFCQFMFLERMIPSVASSTESVGLLKAANIMRLQWFHEMAQDMRTTDPERKVVACQCFSDVGPAVILSVTQTKVDDIRPALLKTFKSRVEVDDPLLLLAMFYEVFEYVKLALDRRKTLLSRNYCDQYIAAGCSSAHLLAYILRRTESHPPVVHPFLTLASKKSYPPKPDPKEFMAVLTNGLMNITFATRVELVGFARIVEQVLLLLLGKQQKQAQLCLSDVQSTWEIVPDDSLAESAEPAGQEDTSWGRKMAGGFFGGTRETFLGDSGPSPWNARHASSARRRRDSDVDDPGSHHDQDATRVPVEFPLRPREISTIQGLKDYYIQFAASRTDGA